MIINCGKARGTWPKRDLKTLPDEQGKDKENFEILVKDDFIRSLFGLPDESIKHEFKKAIPSITDQVLEDSLDYVKRLRIMDPLTLLQPIEPGEENIQYLISHFGPNLELNLFIAQATGSFVYTDSQIRWNEILAADDTFRKPAKPATTEDFEKACVN